MINRRRKNDTTLLLEEAVPQHDCNGCSRVLIGNLHRLSGILASMHPMRRSQNTRAEQSFRTFRNILLQS